MRAARPSFGGDAVVVVGPGRLASIDGRDGTTTWVADTVDDGYPTVQPPDHVAVQQLAEGEAALWVHDGATGEVVLRTTGDGITDLVVVDGAAITHDPTEQELRAVDLATGDLLWRRDAHPGIELAGSADPSAATAALVLRDGRSGTVTRRAPRTGDAVWTTEVPLGRLTRSTSTFLGRPQVVDDLVVVEDEASVVTVLDLATGTERVRIDAGPALDVRSFAPLTLLRDDTWIAVDLPRAPAP